LHSTKHCASSQIEPKQNRTKPIQTDRGSKSIETRQPETREIKNAEPSEVIRLHMFIHIHIHQAILKLVCSSSHVAHLLLIEVGFHDPCFNRLFSTNHIAAFAMWTRIVI
jgi:hypothetical protein